MDVTLIAFRSTENCPLRQDCWQMMESVLVSSSMSSLSTLGWISFGPMDLSVCLSAVADHWSVALGLWGLHCAHCLCLPAQWAGSPEKKQSIKDWSKEVIKTLCLLLYPLSPCHLIPMPRIASTCDITHKSLSVHNNGSSRCLSLLAPSLVLSGSSLPHTPRTS